MNEPAAGAGDLEVQVDKFIFRVRRGYLYSPQDLWVLPEEGRVRVGLTDYWQRVAGDVAFARFPPVGSQLDEGDPLAEVETIKVTLVVPPPVAGKLLAVNGALAEQPELINGDPYGEGWLALLEPAGDLARYGLFDAEAYFALMKGKLARQGDARGGT